MKARKLRIAAAAALACFAGVAGVGRAAMTSFTSAVLASDGSNLDNKGTILQAINFTLTTQPTPTPSPTINGIAFTAFNVPGTASSYSGTNFTLGSSPSGTIIRDDNRTSGLTSAAAVYPLIYNAAVSAATTPTSLVLTLTGLTVGQQYEAQLVFSSDQARSLSVSDDAASTATPGTTGTVAYGTTGGPKVITGLFTADATSQAFDLTAVSSRVQFSGFTLQAVPEPGSLAVASVAAVGLLARRRRQRA